MPTGVEQLILTLLNVTLGGLVVKIIDVLSARATRKDSDAAAFRKELWTEVHNNRDNITALNKEIAQWKDRYYDLERKYNECMMKLEKLTKDER